MTLLPTSSVTSARRAKAATAIERRRCARVIVRSYSEAVLRPSRFPAMNEQVEAARALVASAAHYGHSSVRAIVRGHRRAAEERLVFVVGSPRSGTTFVGEAVGAQPGFVDLGEVKPVKTAAPRLVTWPPEGAAA